MLLGSNRSLLDATMADDILLQVLVVVVEVVSAIVLVVDVAVIVEVASAVVVVVVAVDVDVGAGVGVTCLQSSPLVVSNSMSTSRQSLSIPFEAGGAEKPYPSLVLLIGKEVVAVVVVVVVVCGVVTNFADKSSLLAELLTPVCSLDFLASLGSANWF